MKSNTIELFQIDSFLHDEGYALNFPLKKEETTYFKRGVPDILVPSKESFSDEEVRKILGHSMFKRLLAFIEKASW